MFIDEWCKITRDPVILDIVKHCHLDINVDAINHLFSKELSYKFNAEEQQIITEELKVLLDLKVIEVTQRQAEQIISPIFIRKMKNGGYRIVLNFKELNTHIPYTHFKMENFGQAIRLINAGDYLASVDLRHAYYSVKVADEQRRFLCFQWNGTINRFTCLPNGVSEGPRLFTKLMKPVFATLREWGHSITSFIDDTLICSSTREGCISCINDTVSLLQRLGFCVNLEKSVLVPSHTIEYLGNVVDTTAMSVSLPGRRVDKITEACKKLMRRSCAPIREVARVIGLLVAAFPAVNLGKLHYRQLEMEKIVALRMTGGDFDKSMNITAGMKEDLNWWIHNVSFQHRNIFRSGTDIDLYTDASNIGWGGHLHHRVICGNWSMEERAMHINALELKAILLVLQTFSLDLKGHHIKVFL